MYSVVLPNTEDTVDTELHSLKYPEAVIRRRWIFQDLLLEVVSEVLQDWRCRFLGLLVGGLPVPLIYSSLDCCLALMRSYNLFVSLLKLCLRHFWPIASRPT